MPHLLQHYQYVEQHTLFVKMPLIQEFGRHLLTIDYYAQTPYQTLKFSPYAQA